MATCPTCGFTFEPADPQNTCCPQCGTLFVATSESVAGEPSDDAPAASGPAQASAAPEQPTSTQNGAPENAATASAGAASGNTSASASAAPAGVNPTETFPGAPETSTAPQPVYQPSPLKRAWMDFKASPGKLWIIFKLALFQFVPGVGSLVLNGYVYTWAREQALGRHLPLPQKIVRPGVLDNGLYIYGVSVIMTVALFVLALLSATVFGALGLGAVYVLLVIAFIICCLPFFAAMYMRTALCGRVRSGLNVKRAWSLFAAPGKTGQIFAATWAPAIISIAVTLLCEVVWFAVVVGSAASVAYSMPSAYLPDSYIVAQMLSLMVSFIPITLVLCFAIFFVSTTASIVSARALGYWVQDFHPEGWPEYQENVKYYMDRAV